ncbi:myb-like protein H [Leptopilina boulardi]|uniref:myb-like protein H n=1 Tax=Leptopilina boulardi TaxID=63433 RepID=UPI0021F57855|nr:myb-like protein H [Leptopilina boulardi]
MEKEAMDISNEIIEDNQEKHPQPPTQPPPPPIVRVPVKHTNLGIRSHAMDMSTMVELTSFSTLGKIQPFLVTISTTAALLVDLHCHLTDKEVCGYLGGHWDINSHTLSILGAYPCRYAGKDKTAAAVVEGEIARAMEWKRMILVGWYHSHPRTHASPSLRDVDSQLDYQIKMKGFSDNGYTPCVGLVCSPYNTDGNCYESNFNIFWSLPPPEGRPHEYPRPMLLSYTLSQEHYISQDALEEIKKCIDYYKLEGGIDFKTIFNGNTTYLERLRSSLQSKLPGRNRTNGSYWDAIREMICPGFEDNFSNSLNHVDPFLMKFPLVPEQLLKPNAMNATGNVFLTPLNFKPDNSNSIASITKQFGSSHHHHHHHHQGKDSLENISSSSSSSSGLLKTDIIKHQTHLLQTDTIPSFRAGELTVSLKNAKNEYEYTPPDFTKTLNLPSLDHGKSRASDYPLTDCLTQQMTKYPDLSKLTNFSPSELAKISGFSLNDFTKASSSYMRNIASLFGPLGKAPEIPSEINERRSSDFPSADMIPSPYKISLSPTSQEQQQPQQQPVNRNLIDDFGGERKKDLGETSNYKLIEELAMSNVKTDFTSTLDMSTKKHHSDSTDTLNLSMDR